MNTLLSFMDKLYSDSKTLSIVYVVGAVLLFIFIVMLIISLRKPKDEPKIIEEPKIEEEPTIDKIVETTNEETVIENKNESVLEETKENELSEQPLTEQSIFEKTVIIPIDELQKETKIEEKSLENILEKPEEIIEPKPEIHEEKISAEIPNVDDYVDNIVKKTYEKNEQFSSVYVGDKTSTIKLDKVMEDLNVDENVVESIVPEEEKTIDKVESEPIVQEKNIEEPKDEEIKIDVTVKEVKETTNSLDNLKKALEEKKKEVSLKQDDLKAKLENLKQKQN